MSKTSGVLSGPFLEGRMADFRLIRLRHVVAGLPPSSGSGPDYGATRLHFVTARQARRRDGVVESVKLRVERRGRDAALRRGSHAPLRS